MTAKHTPGPWTYSDTGCLVGGPDRLRIADTYCPERAVRRPDFNECQANARLIAAAPEMLEALQTVDRWLQSQAFDTQTTVRVMALGATIRAAIAKAEGRS